MLIFGISGSQFFRYASSNGNWKLLVWDNWSNCCSSLQWFLADAAQKEVSEFFGYPGLQLHI